MPLSVAPGFLVLADIGLLEIVAAAHQQQLETIVFARMPVKLRSRSRALSKIIKFMRFGRIEEAPRCESVDEEIISEPSHLAAVVCIEIVVVDCGPAKI